MRPKILLLDGMGRYNHYRQLCEAVDAEVLGDPDVVDTTSAPCDLGLISCEYNSTASVRLCNLADRGVPTLHIVDGILEYRNCWANPRSLSESAGMPLFQPILSHKCACIGRSQSRMLEAWGNLGKCEVVGVPRFDALLGRTPRRRQDGDPFRLLIMTAKTPGFTPEQQHHAQRSLEDLHAWISQHPQIGATTLQPVWRVTGGLADRLGVPNELRDTTGEDLADVLQSIDAVITTPSTVMLEAMLQGVPVALLDYNNCPHYVPAAWSITAGEHIGPAVHELMQPPAPKRLLQHTLLHDALECRGPATPRMVTLVDDMLRVAHDCRARGAAMEFPRRMLVDDQDGHHLPEDAFDLQALYPKHPVFSVLDRVALQTELGHRRLLMSRQQAYERAAINRAHAETEQLRHELAAAKADISRLEQELRERTRSAQ